MISGRIRLDEPGASLLLEILTEYRIALIRSRATAVSEGQSTTPYNQRVNRTERIIHEVRRMMDERGWLNEPL